jgi:catechol 2,3-dioxygenase-like lactoylglutathione lyase family enzyme
MNVGSWAWILLVILGSAAASAASAVRGLDHIPVAVADLDRAKADYEALGFVLKPGQPHRNGLRNVHAKFPDGSEIELITAAAAMDELSAAYVEWLKGGDGAPFAGFYAPALNSLVRLIADLGLPLTLRDGIAVFPAPSPFSHLFFGRRQRSPTDAPEHFAHPNTAFGLVRVWLSEDAATQSLLRMLALPHADEPRCAPFGTSQAILAMTEGEIVFVRPAAAGSRRPILGVTIAVASLDAARRVLTENGIAQTPCADGGLWIAPDRAHGVWLELRQTPR